MSFLCANSSNAFSIVPVSVSAINRCVRVWLCCGERLLASTMRKFLLWSWVMCPIPANSSPVTESFKVMISLQPKNLIGAMPRRQ